MVHYDKSIIYKICCKDVNVKEEYVGSTTNFQRRKAQHKYRCNRINDKCYNFYIYTHIRKNGGWDAFDMVEVERYKATDKANLHSRERYWIETLKAELNGNIPTRTPKEYYEDNIEYVTERNKIWYEENREDMLKYKKEWYESNKEQCAEKMKDWYEANKESVNKRQTKKVTCECGTVLSCNNLTAHKRSQQHILFIQSLPPCSPPFLQI